jgi:trans-aconitate 2-methyltransferase
MTSPTPIQTPAQQWDAAAYNQNHAYIWKHGQGLLELLAPQRDERILDIGCGTGQLTQQIVDVGAEVIGIDSAQGMVEQARKNFPRLRFESMDARTFHFAEPFAAIFSSAVLHWVHEHDQVAVCVSRNLKLGGRFVCELGGQGNIKMIMTALDIALKAVGYAGVQARNPWNFPSIGEFATTLEAAGLSVLNAVLFPRPTLLNQGADGMRNWLNMFGNAVLQGIEGEPRETIIQSVEQQLRPACYRDGAWTADYMRLRVVAVKA